MNWYARHDDSIFMVPLPGTTPVRRQEDDGRGCRWPIGDPQKEMFFCHADRRDGSSYCPAHHARAYTPRHQPDKATDE